MALINKINSSADKRDGVKSRSASGDVGRAPRGVERHERHEVLGLLEQLKSEYEQERSLWQKQVRDLESTVERRSLERNSATANSTKTTGAGEPDELSLDQLDALDLELIKLQVESADLKGADGSPARFELQQMWVELPHASAQWSADGLNSVDLQQRRREIEVISQPQPSTRNQRNALMDGNLGDCYISPNGNGRLTWDVMGFILIAYDVLSIPMLAFQMPPNDFSVFMDWLTLNFWSFDTVQSFFLGYYRNGVLITSRFAILKHYMCTWFILDLIILVPEWFMSISGLMTNASNDSDVSSVGKFLRAARAVRVLRRLRLLKLQRFIAKIQEMIESEYAFTLLGLFKLLLCILVLNHVIACGWYLIGNLSMGTGHQNWLEKSGTNGTDVIYSYATSLHWSLTQFTPASMDVSAANVAERVFSIGVLLFAIVAFSSIVASITGMMASINNSQTEQMKQFWLLRKYLRQRHVTKDLTSRIFKYLEHQNAQQQQAVQEANIKLLAKLSDPLRDELQSSIYSPIMVRHGFFESLLTDVPAVLPSVCHSSVRVLALASEDSVFTSDAEARFLYFVKSGLFPYVSKYSMKEKVTLEHNQWICEPTLWTLWRHLGDLVAAVPGELLTVDPKCFVTTLSDYARAWYFAKHYAEEIVFHLNNLDVSELSDLTPDVSWQRITIEKARCSTTEAIQEVGSLDTTEGLKSLEKSLKSSTMAKTLSSRSRASFRVSVRTDLHGVWSSGPLPSDHEAGPENGKNALKLMPAPPCDE